MDCHYIALINGINITFSHKHFYTHRSVLIKIIFIFIFIHFMVIHLLMIGKSLTVLHS